MIGFEADFGVRRWLRSLSIEQGVLRAVLAGAAGVCLFAATQASAAGLGGFWIVVAVLVGFWAVVSPDSAGPATLIAVLALSWWIRVDEPASGWLLVFTLSALVIHGCAALASAGPPSARVGARTQRRWAIAVGTVAAVTLVLWSLFALVYDARVQASTLRLVVSLVAVAMLAWWIRLLSLGTDADAENVSRRDLRP